MSTDITKGTPSTSYNGGWRTSSAWLHTWSGLTLGWILYFVFVTGTVGYFDTEIDRWMQPELPRSQTGTSTDEAANAILNFAQANAPGADQWLMSLPASRNQPFGSLYWRGASIESGAVSASGNTLIDLNNITALNARETGGGQLLYQMHWRFPYMTRNYSDWIISIATFFMFVAIISGIITHKRIFKDFFTFRPGKGQRSWLDAHNVLSVVALPFHLMITYSGLLFMGFSFMPLVFAAYYGNDNGARGQFYSEVFDPPGMVAAAGVAAPLTDLDAVIEEAESVWGENRIATIDIRNPGDSQARIFISENFDQTVAAGAGRLVFDGTSGELLHNAPSASSPAKAVRDVSLGLHEGLFATTLLRWLYFFAGVVGTAMVGTGLVMWTVKRRQQASSEIDKKHRGIRLVEKLNVGTVAGLFVALAAYFWANRLLPASMPGRADWEVHTMFLTWALMLMLSAVIPARLGWPLQFRLGGFAFVLLPVVNMATTERGLIHSLATGDWVFAGFDLTALLCGALLFWIAQRATQVMNKHQKQRAPQTGSTSPIPSEHPVEGARQ
ncbi:iron uptake protein [Pseudohongiella nitratireducens]|uniref:Iron uptake protein n=1 Tax=Pseudohongiella nitratireducens TaxID=1768907 RepID=A0A916VJ41_9GAMM|nr:PepSY-associated TM helix domain-containing protein [Pseudohongiella nitratireducens]MDF1623997.1 PepSY-associated TM helix domain-containing protein [Pseudohongiella nitratireducens]GFZ79492.1 iron uptake protein [Pseudohongiella nitratireducens]